MNKERKHEISKMEPSLISRGNTNNKCNFKDIISKNAYFTDTFYESSDNQIINDSFQKLKRYLEETHPREIKSITTPNSLIEHQTLIQINDYLVSKSQDIKMGLFNYLGILNKERDNIKENKVKELLENIEEELQILSSLLGTLPQYPNIIINVLIGKYQLYTHEIYRMKIVEIVISDNRLLNRSCDLFNIIFNEYMICPLTLNEEKNKEKLLQRFLGFKNEKHGALTLMNNSQNINISKVLMEFFQLEINKFFQRQKAELRLINLSYDYLQLCIQYIDSAILNNGDSLSYISFLYSISYLKVYMYHYVQVKLTDKAPLKLLEVTQTIQANEDNNVFIVNVLKILTSVEQFNSPNWRRIQGIVSDDTLNSSSNGYYFNYPLINIEHQNDYKVLCTLYNNKENFDKKEIKDYQLMMLFDLHCNSIISMISDPDYYKNDNKTLIPSFLLDKLLQLNSKDSYEKLMSLIADSNKFKQRVYPALIKETPLSIEKLLFCYRLCLQCSMITESWYSKLFSANILQVINDSYVPGTDRLNNLVIESASEIELYFKDIKQHNEGVYLCSCGFWYSMGNCGLPIHTADCPVCKDKIGGLNHRLLERKGHVRVYKNQDFKRHVEPRNITSFGHMDTILLEELIKRADDMKMTEEKGISVVSFAFFRDRKKQTRHMITLTYRTLNLILYSSLYYANIAGYLSDQELCKLLPEDTNCKDMIEMNWKLLSEILYSEGIDHIEIFINMLLESLPVLLGQYPVMDTKQQRKDFEIAVNHLINKIIMDYAKYAEYYNDIRKSLYKHMTLSEGILFSQLNKKDYKNIPQYLLSELSSFHDMMNSS